MYAHTSTITMIRAVLSIIHFSAKIFGKYGNNAFVQRRTVATFADITE